MSALNVNLPQPTINLKRTAQGASHLEASSPALRKHTGVVSMMDGCPVSELLAADPIYTVPAATFHLSSFAHRINCLDLRKHHADPVDRQHGLPSRRHPVDQTGREARRPSDPVQQPDPAAGSMPCRAPRQREAVHGRPCREGGTLLGTRCQYFNACSIWLVCCASTCMRCHFMRFYCAGGRDTQVHRHACPTHQANAPALVATCIGASTRHCQF